MSLDRELSAIEVRVLGCLIEKEATTPDQYPLTLNAVRVAANQKTNRFPVSDYEAGQIGHAVRQLEEIELVREVHGARVARYEHRFGQQLEVLAADVAVLCVLMLRGAQTVAEIRAHTQRIHAFDDNDDVQYVLDRLAARTMVTQLPRGPGQKEDRYCQLLSGEPDLASVQTMAASKAAGKASLEQRIERLETELAELREEMAKLGSRYREL